jgi:iron complex outermembrane recepter protein
VGLRPPEFGPVVMSPRTNTDRALLQLDGDLGKWKYSVWGLRSTSTARLNFLSGVYNYSALRDGFAGRNGAPFLNAFGPQSAAGMAYVNSMALTGEMQRADSTLWMAGASFAGTIFQLPGGDAQLALAADYRDDEVSFTVNPAIRGAVGTGIDTSVAAAGSRTAYSLTGELRLPILDILRLDGALRYDHYSDFGSTVNPKILATLEPVDWLEIHGSFNTGFRAPTLYNLFSSVTYPLSATRQSDPVLCTGGVVQAGGVTTRDCNIQFPNQRGGNLNLGPEKTTAYAFGIKLRPIEGLQLQVDYWNYFQKGTIGTLNENVVFANPTQFAPLLVRCGSVANPAALGLVNCTNTTGNPIAYVVQTLQNLGNTKTSGFDLKLAWRGPEWSFGRISFSYNGTLANEFLFQREPNGQYFSRRGAYLDGSVVSTYNHFASLIWDKGVFSGQISNRYTSGYTDCNAQCIGTSAAAVALYRDVRAYSVWDVGFTYRLNERFSLTGRVSNVFDTDPPLTNKTQGLTTGYDERYGDPLGRAYSISITANF